MEDGVKRKIAISTGLAAGYGSFWAIEKQISKSIMKRFVDMGDEKFDEFLNSKYPNSRHPIHKMYDMKYIKSFGFAVLIAISTGLISYNLNKIYVWAKERLQGSNNLLQ